MLAESMRIAIVTSLYPGMIRQFYEENPNARRLPFEQQRTELDLRISLWAGGWARVLVRKGWDVATITVNNIPLQRQWALEHAPQLSAMNDIVLEQLGRFQPDIVWYDHSDIPLLKRIKSAIQSLRLVVGWSGSHVVDPHVWACVNLMFSCAPEVVQTVQQAGFQAAQLHHAFDPDLMGLIGPRIPRNELIFLGQFVRGSNYHRIREEILLRLVKKLDVSVLTPSFSLGIREIVRSAMKKTAGYALSPLVPLIDRIRLLRQNIYVREIIRSRTVPLMPYDRKLKPHMHAPVYGATMLARIRQSSVALNIHADSSPRYASNMRLFEITGAGACLLTDWRENLGSLFEEGTEIVSYRSADECIEKATWLLAHPDRCEEIALRGHQRTLKDHTFDMRADQFIETIERVMARQTINEKTS
jgi:hypothetical protein